MFRAVPCSSSGEQIVLLQSLVSSLFVNSRTLCRHTVWLFTESGDTRGCNNTICPPEDEQGTARNMLRIIMYVGKLTLNLPTTTIVAQPFNIIKWQLKFNPVA